VTAVQVFGGDGVAWPYEKPTTVSEAVAVLLSMTDHMTPVQLAELKAAGVDSLHHSVGREIRNEFGLWTGNQALLHDCTRLNAGRRTALSMPPFPGEMHADDASALILERFQQALHGR
jgi:hypothetical protein